MSIPSSDSAASTAPLIIISIIMHARPRPRRHTQPPPPSLSTQHSTPKYKTHDTGNPFQSLSETQKEFIEAIRPSKIEEFSRVALNKHTTTIQPTTQTQTMPPSSASSTSSSSSSSSAAAASSITLEKEKEITTVSKGEKDHNLPPKSKNFFTSLFSSFKTEKKDENQGKDAPQEKKPHKEQPDRIDDFSNLSLRAVVICTIFSYSPVLFSFITF